MGKLRGVMRDRNFWLTTERLGLRRFLATDLDWLAAYYCNSEATRFLGGTKTRPQVEELLRTRILDYYDEHPGLGIWLTIERTTGHRVGFHILNHIQGEPIIQVGYALEQTAWGQGYATEMASAVLRYGFEDLKLSRIAAITDLDNLASQHVLLKIGLERRGERTFSHPAYAGCGSFAWFVRDADDWLRQHS